jgi:hypothetical protein
MKIVTQAAATKTLAVRKNSVKALFVPSMAAGAVRVPCVILAVATTTFVALKTNVPLLTTLQLMVFVSRAVIVFLIAVILVCAIQLVCVQVKHVQLWDASAIRMNIVKETAVSKISVVYSAWDGATSLVVHVLTINDVNLAVAIMGNVSYLLYAKLKPRMLFS